jgi:serine/threonine protein kinase
MKAAPEGPSMKASHEGPAMKALSHEVELLEPLRAPPGRKIWLGRQTALGRLVEVVTLADGVLPSSPHARQALGEARAHSLLHHAAIREIYSLEVSDSTVTIEREAVKGEALSSILITLDLQRRMEIIAEIAAALAHAHAQRVLHGDLKLDDVLVLADDRVKLDGFSLVLEPNAQAISADAVTGAGLRAPEVRLGAPYGVLAEVYAFGCLAYEILTGIELGDTPRFGKKDSLLVLKPELPPAWTDVLGQCLEPIAAARPAALAPIVERLLFRASPRSRPPGTEQPRVSAKVRRGLLLALLMVIAGVVGVLTAYGLTREVVPIPSSLSVVPLETDSARQAARIRVVARPWAHVFVDGQFYDTTPFATPISVEPGVHTLRLVHPQAGAEERKVQVGPGQTALVDVALRLTRPVFLDPEVDRPREDTP